MITPGAICEIKMFTSHNNSSFGGCVCCSRLTWQVRVISTSVICSSSRAGGLDSSALYTSLSPPRPHSSIHHYHWTSSSSFYLLVASLSPPLSVTDPTSWSQKQVFHLNVFQGNCKSMSSPTTVACPHLRIVWASGHLNHVDLIWSTLLHFTFLDTSTFFNPLQKLLLFFPTFCIFTQVSSCLANVLKKQMDGNSPRIFHSLFHSFRPLLPIRASYRWNIFCSKLYWHKIL